MATEYRRRSKSIPHDTFDNPDLLATGPAHKCEFCYKTFATDARLKKHMAVYAGDETKPLECRTCGKRFLTNAALASHIKTHNNPDTFLTALSAGKNLDKLPG